MTNNKNNSKIYRYFNDSKEFFKTLSKIELVLSLISWVISIIFFIIVCCIQDDGKYGVLKWQVWVGLFANLTNTMCVILSVKMRISSFLWGDVSCVFLGLLAYDAKTFGTMINYWVICIIAQTVLYIQWKRKSENKKTIDPKKMNWSTFIIFVIITILLSVGFAQIEDIDGFTKFWLGEEKQPYLVRLFDSLGLMFTISSIYLLWYKYNQIWIIYLLGDGFLLALWCTQLSLANWKIDDISNSINMLLALATMVSLNVCGMFNWKIQK